MEDIRLFHGEAVSSCEVKTDKRFTNGRIQFGKIIPVKPEDVQIKKFCPWECSEITVSVNGHCIICGGSTS